MRKATQENKFQSASALHSQRFPSTAKKSSNQGSFNLNSQKPQISIVNGSSNNRSQTPVDTLGKYRAIGPKLHAFGARNNNISTPNSPAPTSAADSNTIYDHYLMQRQQHNTQQLQAKHATPSATLAAAQQNIVLNDKQRPSTTTGSGSENRNTIPREDIQEMNANIYKNTGNHNKTNQKLLQKKMSGSSLGSPIHNESSRSASGWALHDIHEQLQKMIPQVSPSGVTVIPTSLFHANQQQQEQQTRQSAGAAEAALSVESEETLSEQKDKDQTDSNITTLRAQLQTIFHFYTTFGDRQNINSLKSNKFYKMMQDAGIVSSTITSTRIDLLFCQANKHKANMVFDTFLDTLPKIATLKYPEETVQDAMLYLITNQLTPLYKNIIEKTDLGIELQSFSQPLEIDCVEILTPLYPMLQKIYEAYFPWEPQTSMPGDKTYEKSLKSLLVFLGEYEMCPTHFSKSTAFLLYNYLVQLKNISSQFAVQEDSHAIFGFKDYGVTFSFQRFLLYLIRSSLICYEHRADRAKFTCSSHLEKLNLLLERMQVSPGFLNIQKKTHITNNSHTSLLIPSTLAVQLSMNKSIDWSTPRASQFSNFRQKPHDQSNAGSSASFFNTVNTYSRNNSLSSSQIRKSILIEKIGSSFQCANVVEKHQEALKRIFVHYCSIGEPMNSTTLKTIKLIRLLTDAGIIKKTNSSSQQANSAQENKLNSSNRTSLQESASKRTFMLSAATQHLSEDIHNLQNDETQDENGTTARSNALKSIKRAYLSKIDMDFMVAKLTGHKWIQSFNSQATFNTRVPSPNLGFRSHLFKNDNSVGAKGKIEFEHFLKLLEMIADKLYPHIDLQTALTLITEEHILKIDVANAAVSQNRKTIEDYFVILMETIKDPEIVTLLGEAHTSLAMYFRLYQDLKGFMNIRNFIKFFQDFDIFPTMLSKATLSTIFYLLAQIQATQANQSNNEQPPSRNVSTVSASTNRSRFLNDSSLSAQTSVDQNEQEFINQHLFVEGIVLLAMEIYSEIPSNKFKIIMMLEKMNNSQGPILNQRKLGHTRSTDGQHWDILHSIRRKYPEFYKQQNKNQTLNNDDNSLLMKPGNFQEIVRQSLARQVNASQVIGGSGNTQDSDTSQQLRQSYYASSVAQGQNNVDQYQQMQEEVHDNNVEQQQLVSKDEVNENNNSLRMHNIKGSSPVIRNSPRFGERSRN